MAKKFEAIYQFGDSLSDTGNYVREATGENSSYNKLPYGQSYYPTGRASNGLLMVDYIGATANGRYNSLARQLTWFRYHLISTYSYPTAIRKKLENSLVIMGEIGGNDFNGPFNQGKTIHEVAKLIPGVLKTIKNAVEEVITLGATSIVVPGNFPIGCVPLYLVNFVTNDSSKYDKLGCLKDYNNFSKFYNQRLKQVIRQLQREYPDVAIVYADYYSALSWVIANAPQLGIEQGDTTKVCCGTGDNPYNFGGKGCGSPGSWICEDPNKRISWDGVHMTQEGNKGVADQLLEQFVPALDKQIRRRRRRKPIR
ncbi:hypothetical protein SOVF_198470 [Spinacia oleracea]|nr:hypothetical protein SOVF_198470 [Spinacia oleracea]